LKLWQEEKSRQDKLKQEESIKHSPQSIDIIVKNVPGQSRDPIRATKHQTTPWQLVGKYKPAQPLVIARVTDPSTGHKQLWDMSRPLEYNCELEVFDYDSKEGQSTFWHSSAHLLGQAIEEHYKNIQLCDGPALSSEDQHGGGFFYEFQLGDKNMSVNAEDYANIEEIVRRAVKKGHPFERMLVSKEFAMKMFGYNPFKVDLLNHIPADEPITVYKSGTFIDLCRGPHISNTAIVKAFNVTKTSSAYYLGDPNGLPLQRMYGISFPDKNMLADWKRIREEIQKRDHRVVGKSQKLLMFSSLSPGSAFFLPHGTRIYNKLVEFLRNEYLTRGYQEVITPLLFDKKLWEQSGHWQHYKENMFLVTPGEELNTEPKPHDHSHEHNHDHEHEHKEELGLKPMNCPGHCLVFDQMRPSYKDLPIRLADFSPLHRNEKTGALTGLTRVRRFSQDDGHIFCTPEQISTEIDNVIDMLHHIYTTLGFTYQVLLSTRPEKYMGDIDTWNQAEKALADCLEKRNINYQINAGDGAFYGPKIDVILSDVLNRKHQCATIQLDFQLPRRFNLKYVDSDGQEKTPVIIHRAILGSVERMFAILIEHTAGKWPFWLSPRQCLICTVSDKFNDYAQQVTDALKKEKFYVDFVKSDETLPKKIRSGQTQQYNYILVIGEEEVAAQKVNVRTRDGTVHGLKTVDELINEFKELMLTRQ
jgi:threonyl-tRNA synthetase